MTRKTVLITGAARGIGRATADHFARAGWFVGLYDIDAKGVSLAAREISASTGQETTASGVLDVTDPEGWRACLEEFWGAGGQRLDALINNAGILAAGELADIPLARQAAIVDVNVKGVLFGCHTAFPYLRRTPGSCVVNLCSASALYGQPGLATYGATKAAVRSLTEALDLEWSRQGIRVCDVLPLFVDTEMGVEATAGGGRYKLLGMHLTAEDVAKAVFDAAERPPRLAHPHRTVGLQTRLAGLGIKVAPERLVREIVNRTAR